MLEHPLQHQFAPVALGLLALERAGQVGRFLAQAQVELLQTLQFLAQGETLARFLLVAFSTRFSNAWMRSLSGSSICPRRC